MTDHAKQDNVVDLVDRNELRPVSVYQMVRRPTPRWLVRGILPERAFAVVFGAPGSGKTFVSLDLACSVALGKRWFGKRTRPGSVIYVASEGHLKLRLLAYLQHHNLDAEDLYGLYIVPTRVNLMNPATGDLDSLIAEIKQVAEHDKALEGSGVVLVVLDTLNAMMPGGNENASEDMGAMIGAAGRIKDAIDCAVLFVHHSGKDETKGSRGHSSLKAAVDCEIQVSGDGDRVAEVLKVRDGEPGQRFGFRLQTVDLGDDPDPEADAGDHLSSCAVVPLDHIPKPKAKPPRRDVALDALKETIFEFGQSVPETSTIPPGVKAVTLDQWRSRWSLRTGYEGSTGNSIAVNFHKDKDALLTAGAIGISKPYVWVFK